MKLSNSHLRRLVIVLCALAPLILFCAQSAYAGAPCCQITAINSSTGVVTARVNATGQIFQFTVKNTAQLKQLRVGQGVYANLSSKTMSLDGRSVAGNIVSVAAPSLAARGGPAPASPLAGAQVLASSMAASGTTSPPAPSGTSASGSTAASPAPGSAVTPGSCCTVTSVNSSTGVVTAKVNSTGQVFTFTLANNALLGQLRPGHGVFANLGRKQVSLDGNTVSGTIVASPLGGTLANSMSGQSGSSAASSGGACNATAATVTVCSPIPGSTVNSPVQITAAAMPFYSSSSINAMRVFVDSGPTSAFTTNAGSLNTLLAMSVGSHNILVRAWEPGGGAVYEKSVGVIVNSAATGSSGSAANSGTTNPQPVTYSCGSTPDPTSDGCSKTWSSATSVGVVTCGSSITITGITPSGPGSDWLMFQVTTPRANCANLVIAAALSSSPANQAAFDVLVSPGAAVITSYGPCAYGVAISCVNGVGLGSQDGPLLPGWYYIRVYGTQSAAPSTWTLKITG